MKKLIIATRGSKLALAQTDIVCELLKKQNIDYEIKVVHSKGDHNQKDALSKIGGNGLFIRSLETELIEGNADIAVHSAKDLPYDLEEGLVIGGVPKRGEARDCLVTLKGAEPEQPMVIGTGSPRRISELKQLYPEAVFENLRGNVDTRLRKLSEGQYTAIVVAAAALDRLDLDLQEYDIRRLDIRECIPAVCQGMIAVECREKDKEIVELLDRISDPVTKLRFGIERYLFSRMKADCTLPIGAHAEINGKEVRISAMFRGRRCERTCKVKDHMIICEDMAKELTGNCTGKVTLVGAGCGEGLITLKGLEAISEADVVVYDDLLAGEVLSRIPQKAKRIYVGKRSEKHSLPQEEINRILIREAQEGNNVVRLKGGDSFVFGRGGEEILALMEENIRHEVIPGVTSCVAVPERFGIPVTHRGVARSFTVVTGHTMEDGEIKVAWKNLAKNPGTLVFLMGIKNLREICGKLIEFGKPEDTPVSVLAKAYSSEEQRLDGKLSDIADVCEGKALTPGIIVIGPVAGMDLRSDAEKKTITVTGTERFVNIQCKALENLEAKLVPMTTMEVRFLFDKMPKNFEDYSWIVFTSRNGIEAFFSYLMESQIDLRSIMKLKFACIGSGTVEDLRAHGFHTDFVPSEYTAEVLGRELAEHLGKNDRCLLLRAEISSEALSEELEKGGIDFEDVPIYRTLISDELAGDIKKKVDSDYVIFGSGRGVEAFFTFCSLSDGTVPVCIGPSTAKKLKEHYDGDFLMAGEYTAGGISEVILKDMKH
ncbi:hydroxymethylbilane synthase [Oribacterium sp. KHPX15]|uniref:uroporphyrinogen-III C-methyltransferase n=1 Tax=Oribacterium sp. KHPX15 TaxID=1855342 RepID=UPI0008964440|nr:uroporphyrinogen-III C-methyltransferase [Oribacterium sp. KHPX15]SEA65747.1 hydroxymethylbilane synthase [Oribacterium sp. KHPX15]